MDFMPNTQPVTDEEFNSFHRSDRRVYYRLVFNLRRDPAESSRVMALWIWLEYAVRSLLGRGLIPWIILPLIDPELNALAEEAVTILACVEMDSSLPPPPPLELPMFRRLVWKGHPVNLLYFYDNRLSVLRGVAERSNSVCLRAFRDIMQSAVEWRAGEVAAQMMLSLPPRPISTSSAANNNPQPALIAGNVAPVLVMNNHLTPAMAPPSAPAMAYYYSTGINNNNNNNNNNNINTNTGFGGSSESSYYYYNNNNNNNSTGVTTRVDETNNNDGYIYNMGQVMSEYISSERRGEVRAPVPAPVPTPAPVPMAGSGGGGVEAEVTEMSEILRGLEIGLEEDDNNNMIAGSDYDYGSYGLGFVDFDEIDDDEVPVDERTIFLTFSKGYPITEKEVRDYFTSKFGDALIEAIYMQEVRSRDEQPLFARLVVRSLPLMDFVLRGHSRVKFSIAGKHVWARKYVRKNMSKFADSSSSSSPIFGPSQA